jgi:hypothetical protein
LRSTLLNYQLKTKFMKCTLISTNYNTNELYVEFDYLTKVFLPWDRREEMNDIINSTYYTCHWSKDFTRLYDRLIPFDIQAN